MITIGQASLAVAGLVAMCDGMHATAVMGGDNVDLAPVVDGVRSGLLLALAVMTEDEEPGEDGLRRALIRAVRHAFESGLIEEDGR